MPYERTNLSGQRFGRLVVEKLSGRTLSGDRIWLCRCKCGGIKIARTADLRKLYVSSCGCFRRELLKKRMTTHGMSNTRTFKIWAGMIKRCRNKNDHGWPRYGGRGIVVCKRWQKFINFFTDMGYAPLGLTLERINNDGDYEPRNCKWATQTEQALNRSTSLKNRGKHD